MEHFYTLLYGNDPTISDKRHILKDFWNILYANSNFHLPFSLSPWHIEETTYCRWINKQHLEMVTKINSAGWPKTIKNSFGCSTNNPIMHRKKIYFTFLKLTLVNAIVMWGCILKMNETRFWINHVEYFNFFS